MHVFPGRDFLTDEDVGHVSQLCSRGNQPTSPGSLSTYCSRVADAKFSNRKEHPPESESAPPERTVSTPSTSSAPPPQCCRHRVSSPRHCCCPEGYPRVHREKHKINITIGRGEHCSKASTHGRQLCYSSEAEIKTLTPTARVCGRC